MACMKQVLLPGLAYDDLNASISSDFGTIYLDSAGDDVAIGGFDEKSNKAGEGSQTGALNGIMGSVIYLLDISFHPLWTG